MANKYLRTAGGNSSADASWSTTSGGSADTVKPTASDDVILDALSGNLTVDANMVCKTFTEQVGYVGTVTHNAFTITSSGSLLLVAGSTYTPLATSTVSFNASATLTTGGKLMPKIACTSGTLTLGDNFSAMASKLMQFTLSGTALDLNGKTVSGNSAINRLLFTSATAGTSASIIVNGGTFAYADFKDIAFTNATNLNLSAITGLSGDCGGNTLTGGGSTLTFTTPATQTATGTASFTWSTHGWTSRVPLPQDNVVINNAFIATRTVTADMPRLGASIDFTGATNTPIFALGLDCSLFGSLTLISGQTMNGNFILTSEGRSTSTLTTNGATTSAVQFTNRKPTSTFNLAQNTTAKGLFFGAGTFDSGNYTITLPNQFVSFTFTDTGVTKVVNLGTSTIDFSATNNSGTFVSMSASSGATLNASNSTIVLSAQNTNLRTFSGASFTYGVLTYTVAGSTGGLDFVANNSFSAINFSDVTNARTIRFTAGSTTTIRTLNGFNVNGTSGKLMTVSSITGAFHTLTSSFQQSCDYLNIVNSHATGGPWYAGANSVDGGGNTGWIFTAPPTSAFRIFGDEGMVS